MGGRRVEYDYAKENENEGDERKREEPGTLPRRLDGSGELLGGGRGERVAQGVER